MQQRSSDEIVKTLREKGLRVTPQRFAVYANLLARSDHPTVEQLLTTLNREVPTSSQATVYAALQALRSVGLVQEVLLDYAHHRRFVKDVAESRIVQRKSDAFWVYQRLDLPAIADRDFTLRVTWGSTGDDLWTHFVCDNDEGPPPHQGVVRVSIHEGHWTLQPIADGQATHARYQVHLDLAGSLPAWMARSGAAKEIPALSPEPAMPPWPEVLGSVHVSTYKNWDDLGRWYWGLIKDQFDLDEEMGHLRAACQSQPEVLRAFVEIQLRFALAARDMAGNARRRVVHAAGLLGFAPGMLDRMEAAMRGNQRVPAQDLPALTAAAYRTLETEPSVSNTELTRVYRRLMSRHHPDKLKANGLPESMLEHAKQRTQAIREAYEMLRDQRGMS